MTDTNAILTRLEELERKAEERETKRRLERLKLLPSQAELIKAYNDPKISTIIFTGPNQVGKSLIIAAGMSATVKGYQPWDQVRRRFKPPVRIALLLKDYDNHATKFLEQNLRPFWPKNSLKIDRTQSGGPRHITFHPYGSTVHIFTHDQESDRAEGGTYHELYVDEPCPRQHVIAIQRGLSFFGGKTIFTMTPLSEPWIFDDVYNKAGNMGGERQDIYAITAFPDENLQSKGGYLDDESVRVFRENLSEEEREARVHGRWAYLLGRVYKDFDERVHVLDDDLVPEKDRCYGVSVDPHDRIPFAIAFFYLTPTNDLVFYDEFPHEPFENFTSCNLVYDDYVPILRQHPSFWKLIDPNFARKKSAVNGLTVAEELQIRGLAFDTSVNDDLTAGHQAVAQRLKWDKTRPRDALNQPKLFIKRNCRNLIHSIRSYIWSDWRGRASEGRSPKQVPVERYKHFCDCIRYACMARVKYLNVDTTQRTPYRYGHGWEASREDRENESLFGRRAFGRHP